MARYGRSVQHRQSLGRTRVVGAYEQAPKPEKPGGAGRGEQGTVACPVCGGEVTIKKANYNDGSAKDEIKKGTPVISPHRHGGGIYRARRGDVRCRGTHQPI